VKAILNKNSELHFPEIDDELRRELRDKDLGTDEKLRSKFLPKMNQAYKITLNGHEDNVQDYKFFVKKAVANIPELQVRYTNPYVRAFG